MTEEQLDKLFLELVEPATDEGLDRKYKFSSDETSVDIYARSLLEAIDKLHNEYLK